MPYYPETGSNKRPDVYAQSASQKFRNNLIDAYPGSTIKNIYIQIKSKLILLRV